MSDVGQHDSTMEQKGKRDNSPYAQKLPLVSLDLFLYFLFLFSHKEGGGGTVGGRTGKCRLCRSNHASFIAPRCNNRGGKAAGLHKCGIKA
jgi:hypothetical protein